MWQPHILETHKMTKCKFAIQLLALAAISFIFITPARADYQTGLSAYRNKNYTVAWANWKQLAEKGDAKAQNDIGYMYLKGYGVQKDAKKAMEWFKKSSDLGFSGGSNNIGIAYYTIENYTQAFRWFKKAAQQGNKNAQMNLAKMYEEGKGTTRDLNAAVEWYKKAAQQGNTKAQNRLGILYQNGKGVKKDQQTATKYFEKAAEKGYQNALINLGLIYHYGKGTQQNVEKAAAYYQRAAQQKNDYACYMLGRLYDYRIKPRNEKAALSWYVKAAKLDNASAAYRLGQLYSNEESKAFDPEKAAMWLKKADKQGLKKAGELLDELEAKYAVVSQMMAE